MTTNANPNTPRELLQKAQQAYDKGDDKTCARCLWEAVFASIRQLAAQMGHPCQDEAQAKKFARYLQRQHGNEFRNADAMLGFALDMLDHAEGGEWSQDPEFAWTSPEFPLAIRQITHIVDAFTAEPRATKSNAN